MNGWFIAIVIINVLNLGIYMAKHGEPRNEKYNFWAGLIGVLISLALVYMAVLTGF